MEFFNSVVNHQTYLFYIFCCFQRNGHVQHVISNSTNDEVIGMLTMIISFEEIHNVVLTFKKKKNAPVHNGFGALIFVFITNKKEVDAKILKR